MVKVLYYNVVRLPVSIQTYNRYHIHHHVVLLLYTYERVRSSCNCCGLLVLGFRDVRLSSVASLVALVDSIVGLRTDMVHGTPKRATLYFWTSRSPACSRRRTHYFAPFLSMYMSCTRTSVLLISTITSRPVMYFLARVHWFTYAPSNRELPRFPPCYLRGPAGTYSHASSSLHARARTFTVLLLTSTNCVRPFPSVFSVTFRTIHVSLSC